MFWIISSFVVSQQANRWWLHLYRLLTGEWSEDLQASNPLQPNAQSDSVSAATTQAPAKVFKTPDWPSARTNFPDWLWSGLVLGNGSLKTAGGDVDAPSEGGGFDAASLDHARGEGQGFSFAGVLLPGNKAVFLVTVPCVSGCTGDWESWLF